MIQTLKAPVSVILKFDHRQRKTYPLKVTWEGRDYAIIKIGLHHTYRQGRTLYHVFSVASRQLFFKLILNTDNLQWTVVEIADGNPS